MTRTVPGCSGAFGGSSSAFPCATRTCRATSSRFWTGTRPNASRKCAARSRRYRQPSIPSYRALHLDDGGTLWIERYRLPWDPGVPVFDVFGTDGRWLGEVTAPTGLEVHQIGEDYVLGVTRDESDVPFVVLHRLNKPG